MDGCSQELSKSCSGSIHGSQLPLIIKVAKYGSCLLPAKELSSTITEHGT